MTPATIAFEEPRDERRGIAIGGRGWCRLLRTDAADRVGHDEKEAAFRPSWRFLSALEGRDEGRDEVAWNGLSQVVARAAAMRMAGSWSALTGDALLRAVEESNRRGDQPPGVERS